MARVTSQEFSDNFNRASLGSDWNVATGTVVISSNQMTCTAAAGEVTYTASQPSSADQYCKFTVTDGYDTTGTRPQIAVRATSDYQTLYHIQFRVDQDDALVYRRDSGTWTSFLAQAYTPSALTNGDEIETRVYTNGSGNPVLEAYQNGTKFLTYEDTSASKITSNGYVGMRFSLANKAFMDDFEGGTYEEETPIEISVSDSVTVSENVSNDINNYVIFDQFTGSNGSAITGRTPDTYDNGNTYFNSGLKGLGTGGGEIQSNQCSMTVNNGGHLIETSYSDVKVGMKFIPAVSSINRGSLAFRANDSYNQWYFNFREDNSDWQLGYYSSGGDAVVDSSSYTWTEGQTYEIMVICNGNSIKVYVDDELVSSVTNSTLNTETAYGFNRHTGSSATRYDDFYVTTDLSEPAGETLEVSVSDSTTLSENVSNQITGTPPDLSISVSDLATVTDVPGINPPESIHYLSVSDSTTVTDAPQVELGEIGTIEVSVSEGAFVNGYTYARPITIDKDEVDADLTDYIFWFDETENDFKTTGNGGKLQNGSGYDMAFYSDSKGLASSELDYDRRVYNASTGETKAWVRIPNVSSTEDTVIYVFYGNSSISSYQGNASGTWQDYYSVYHNEMASGTATDSSGNGRHMTAYGTPTYQSSTTKLGIYSVEFNGSNNLFYDDTDWNTSTPSEYSMSTWIRYDTFQSAPLGTFGSMFDSYVSLFFRGYNSGGTNYFRMRNSTTGVYTTMDVSPYSADTWYHIVGTWSQSENKAYFYINGSEVANQATSGTSSGTPSVQNTMTGYRTTGGSQFMDGWVDEMWYGEKHKSAAMVAAEYSNQNNPSGFYTLEAEITEATYGVKVTESVNVSYPLPTLTLSVSDTATTSEFVSLLIYFLFLFASTQDTVTVSEFVDAVISVDPREASTSDTVTVSENVNIVLGEPTLVPNVSDTVTVTDTPNIDPPYFGTLQIHVIEGQQSNGYHNRWDITINRTELPREDAGTTTDMTLPFVELDSVFATEANGGRLLTPNGYDMLFTDDADNPLDYQRVQHNLSTGQIEYWVRHDYNNRTATSDTTIRLYFGKKNVADQETATPFDTKYKFKLHLENNVTDSSSYTQTITNNGTTDIAAIMGRGRDFDSTNPDYLSVPHSSDINHRLFCFGMWINRDASTLGTDLILATKTDGTDGWWFFIDGATNRLALRTKEGSTDETHIVSQDPVDQYWRYVGVILWDLNDRPYFFNNAWTYGGVGSWTTKDIRTTGNLEIGRDSTSTYNDFEGIMDNITYWVNNADYEVEDPFFTEHRLTRFAPSSNATISDETQRPTATDTPLLAPVFPTLATTTDTATVSENVTVELKLPTPTPSVSDTATVSENVNITIGIPFPTPNVDDNVTVSEDIQVEVPELFGSTSDTVTVTDTPIIDEPYTIPLYITEGELVNVSESVSISTPDFNIQLSESVTVSENVALVLSSDAEAIDSVTVSEFVSVKVSDLVLYASESVTVSEDVFGAMTLWAEASDTITVSESINNLIPIDVRGSDLVIALDVNYHIQPTIEISVGDSVAVSESVAMSYVLILSVADAVSVSEVLDVAPFLINVDVEELVSVSEGDTLVIREPPSHKPEVEDTVTVGEGVISVAVLEVGALGISVIDNVTVTETNINVVRPFPPIYVSDTVTVTDTPSAVTPTVIFPQTSDTITVSDTVLPEFVDIVIPPESHDVWVYDVTVVTEQWVVDRDIWGGNIPDEEGIWGDQDEPTTEYREIDDPTTEWRDADEHER